MKKEKYIILFFILSITAVLFYLINITTAHPRATGGNGNPGLIFMFPAIPLYVYLSISLYSAFSYFFTNITKNRVSVYTLISLLLFIGLIIGEYYYVQTKLIELGSPYYPNSKVNRLTLLGPFINDWYFNAYTFFFLPLLAVIISGIKCIFSRQN